MGTNTNSKSIATIWGTTKSTPNVNFPSHTQDWSMRLFPFGKGTSGLTNVWSGQAADTGQAMEVSHSIRVARTGWKFNHTGSPIYSVKATYHRRWS